MNISDMEQSPPKLKGGGKDKELWLSLQDIENLLVLLQQVKISVGVYPFNTMRSVSETIEKLGGIYETLKNKNPQGDDK